MVQFEKEALKDTLIFRRFDSGDVIQLGMETMLAQVDGEGWSLRVRSPEEKIVIGEEGAWYGINYCGMLQRVGFSELIPYCVEAIPNQRFQLGFYADMKLRAVHIQGLLPYMRGRDRMTMLDLLIALRTPMENAAIRAIEAAVETELPDLSWIIERRSAIENKIEASLFPLFYRNGLCITPHSFSIKGFAAPLLH